jgi:hypothetical protein
MKNTLSCAGRSKKLALSEENQIKRVFILDSACLFIFPLLARLTFP